MWHFCRRLRGWLRKPYRLANSSTNVFVKPQAKTELSLLDKNLVKRKCRENDPEVIDIMKRYLGKNSSTGRVESLGLQVELKKYLANLRPQQTRQIKLVTEKRFRLPLNYQRSTIDLHKRLSDREVSGKRAPSANIEHEYK